MAIGKFLLKIDNSLCEYVNSNIKSYMNIFTKTINKLFHYGIQDSAINIPDPKIIKLKVSEDKYFNKNNIEIHSFDSSLILTHVFTIKECEKLLLLNCINNKHEYPAISNELAFILSERIGKIIKYNTKFGTFISNRFIFSEFIDKSKYFNQLLNANIYIFLNSGFKNGTIKMHTYIYKPKSGSVLITKHKCIGDTLKNGSQYVIQGSLFKN